MIFSELKIGETYNFEIVVDGTHGYYSLDINGTMKVVKREGLIPMKDIKVYASDNFYSSAMATLSKMHL